MSLYHLRIIERLWGSRKFAVGSPTTFLISHFLSANADIQVVLSLQHSSTYSRTPSNCRIRVSPSHIRRGEPPARRPDAPHLCPPRSIPRRDPYNL